MPEICRSCGEFTAPPHSTTSRAALSSRAAPAWWNAAPTQRRPAKSSRVATAPVSMRRFERPLAAARKVRAVEPRKRPLRVIWE